MPYKWLRKDEKRKTRERGKDYTQLNAEFQRGEFQQGEIGPSSMNNAKKKEENKMGKSRHLFDKIGHIKGTFHARWAQ